MWGQTIVAFVCLLAGGLLMVFTVPWVQPELRASRGEGDIGVFTAVETRALGCGRGVRRMSNPCWRGEFHSTDGHRYLPRVWLADSGVGDISAGQKRQAIDVGHGNQVYPYPFVASTAVLGWVYALIIGAVIVVASLVWLVRSLRRLRRTRSAGHPSSGPGITRPI
ncbi:hypothetical protein GCM10022226_05660 [Sphaerisporangium flaviroseum]|uniref:DUF3592 domain-containing protein n=1 Tax=Sphaerisporangium flaviroseum TaxID=509199 RepID=A0ABP7HAM7_9ACTN